MTDDRDPGFGLYARHQALAAARHQHVDELLHAGKHLAHRGAIGGGNQLDGARRQARRLESFDEAGVDGRARAAAVRSAAQNRGVTRLQAQRTGVGGHVGPTLIDDADDSERHAHAADLQPVGPGPFGDGDTDWIGECGDLFQAERHGLDAPGIELESIQQCAAHIRELRIEQVLGVGREDQLGLRSDGGSGGAERLVLDRGVGQREPFRGRDRGSSQVLHHEVQIGRLAALRDRCNDAGHGFTSANPPAAPGGVAVCSGGR